MIADFNKTNGQITKLTHSLKPGDTFELTGYEKIETTFGENIIIDTTHNEEELRCWATTDIIRLIINEPFKHIWLDPSFVCFSMTYDGKTGQKYTFSINNILTTNHI